MAMYDISQRSPFAAEVKENPRVYSTRGIQMRGN
jgi:hypothetical protein